MSVVIDANLLVVLVTGDERGQLVEAKLRAWQQAKETLHAPALMPYEAVNAIVRAAVAANLSAELVDEMWARVAEVPVELHALQDGAEVAAVARRLNRQNAYDAPYVALRSHSTPTCGRSMGRSRATRPASACRSGCSPSGCRSTSRADRLPYRRADPVTRGSRGGPSSAA